MMIYNKKNIQNIYDNCKRVITKAMLWSCFICSLLVMQANSQHSQPPQVEIIQVKINKTALQKMKQKAKEYRKNKGLDRQEIFIINDEIDRALRKYSTETSAMKPLWKDEFSYQLAGTVAKRRAKGLAVNYNRVLTIVEDLKPWYYFVIHEGYAVSVVEELKRMTGIEDARISPKHKPSFIPNDPHQEGYGGSLNYNDVHRFYEAWDITEGSSDVVIAIVDSGVRYTHEDLKNKLWTNPGEIPGNGIDDDNNGFVDDIHGYDFFESIVNTPNGLAATDDPYPYVDSRGDPHGTTVAGFAVAEVNNATGIAGSGYRSSLMITKHVISDTSLFNDSFFFTDYGVLYAILNGADVINMSYGSDGYDPFEQAIMQLGQELGVVLIAAAGNGRSNMRVYPGAYPEVFSVAAGISDGSSPDEFSRAGFTTYGPWVDVSATGIMGWGLGADTDTQYRNERIPGTSFASPVVAGLAGLLRAEMPDLSSESIYSIIRRSTDDIDMDNPDYAGLLGTGSINAERALQWASTWLVEPLMGHQVITYYTSPKYDATAPYGVFNYRLRNLSNDTLRQLTIDWDHPSGTRVYPSSTLIDVLAPRGEQVLQHFVFFGDNVADYSTNKLPFTLRIDYDGAPSSRPHYDFEYQVGLIDTVEHGIFTTSFTTTGRLFQDGHLRDDFVGLGLKADDFGQGRDFRLVKLAGLMLASPLSGQVASSIETNPLGSANSITLENDFVPLSAFEYDSLSQVGIGHFRTREPDFPRIEIEHRVRFNDNDLLDQTIFIEYSITNNSPSQLDSIYPGLYLDLDLNINRHDSISFRFSDSLFFVKSSAFLDVGSPNNFVGMYTLSDNPTYFPILRDIFLGFDLLDGYSDVYSDVGKIESLTSGLTYADSLNYSSFFDKQAVIGTGALNFEIGQTHDIHYAITFAGSLGDLTERTNAVKRYYKRLQQQNQGDTGSQERLFITACEQTIIDGENSNADLLCQTQGNRFSLTLDVGDGEQQQNVSSVLQLSHEVNDWQLYDTDNDGDKDLFYADSRGLFVRSYSSSHQFGTEHELTTSGVDLFAIGQINSSHTGGCRYDNNASVDLFFSCFLR